jgi:capsular polysaccharide biosynthesis protein
MAFTAHAGQRHTNGDQTVNDPEHVVAWSGGISDDLQENLAVYEDSADFVERPAGDPATPLVSMGFLMAAVRRRTRLWCILAVVGLVLGAGYYAAKPLAYEASTTVLLVDNSSQNPADEIQTDIVMAESIPVASAVVHQLGYAQTPASFLSDYSVAMVTPQLLTITAKGTSSDQAVQRAAAVATQFLDFRAQNEQAQQQQTDAALQQQVTQAQQHLNSINSQIRQLSSQSGGTSQQSQLSVLQAQRTQATNALGQVQQYATTEQASTQTLTQQMVQGSEVLNKAAPLKRSVVKSGLLYVFGGLLGGLLLGIIIVIIGAITSDRLRRRDDIAYVLGAPVRVSVGPLREGRIPALRGRAARSRDMERVVEHLRTAVPGSSSGPAGLAVVEIDDAPTAAKAVVELAIASAKQRRRVVLADLSAGAEAARLLKVAGPGISTATPEGMPIVVVVPKASDVAPIGPLRSHAFPEGYAQADEQLTAASAHADLVLSLVTLNPAFGGEYLATWATDAVAMVTAGQSTALRLHAAGEMVRLAGVRLSSIVLIDADKSDESLGVTVRGAAVLSS